MSIENNLIYLKDKKLIYDGGTELFTGYQDLSLFVSLLSLVLNFTIIFFIKNISISYYSFDF
ncbi:hypothetical protein CKY10_07720 [Photorhabdus sp. HUG-39]|nr:hypothetical protein CKY10_07720 [Photorhabdus sp. HUG-39]